jgi:uncharacterized protein (DUF427 family)
MDGGPAALASSKTTVQRRRSSMAKEIKVPGPDHPITIEPTPGRVVVRLGDVVVADSTAALSLRESTYPVAQYIPLEDVDRSLITRTGSSTYCPFKGDASYYSLTGPDGELTDVIWTYEKPYPSVESIAGYVSFYPDRVDISVGEPAA